MGAECAGAGREGGKRGGRSLGRGRGLTGGVAYGRGGGRREDLGTDGEFGVKSGDWGKAARCGGKRAEPGQKWGERGAGVETLGSNGAAAHCPPPRLPAPQEPRSPHRSHLFITAPTICSSLILMRAAGALRPLLENAQKNHGNPKNAPKAVKKDPEGKANPAAVRPPAPREPPAPPAPLRHRRCFGFAQNPPNSPQSRPSVPIALSPLLMSANELRPLLIAPLLSAHRPPMRRGVDPPSAP